MKTQIYHILFVVVSLLHSNALAQDTLVMHNGRRLAISKLTEFTDGIEVRTTGDKKNILFPLDSIFGYVRPFKEQAYFLKIFTGADTVETYRFVDRIHVGNISLFQSTKGNLDLYLEKQGDFEQVYHAGAGKVERAAYLQTLLTFFDDDEESMRYLQSGDFKAGLKSLQFVLAHYNERNFVHQENTDNDLKGAVFLYRTPFQKTKEGIKITVNGERHYLYINDYIRLDLPINYPSKLTITDGLLNSVKLMSGSLESQYYEVLYDRKNDAFKFDKKGGTELQFEFHNIKDKVGKKD